MAVGSIVVDVTVQLAAWPEPGGDALSALHRVAPGGGFNVLAQACRLGMTAAYAGRVGDGPFGQMVRDALAQWAVPVLLPSAHGEDTGFVIALVDAAGEPTYITAPGAEAHVRYEDLMRVPLTADDILYVSGYDLGYAEAGAAIARWLAAQPDPLTVVWDPGPWADRIPLDRLQVMASHRSLLTANAREAWLLSGEHHPVAAAEQLAHAYGVVVVRTGALGAVLAQRGRSGVVIPGRPAHVVDATGAGDIHTATLIAGIAQGWAWLKSVQVANVAASMATEAFGGSAGPTWTALTRELARGGCSCPADPAGPADT